MGGNHAVCTTIPARIVASLSVVMAAQAGVTGFGSLVERCKEEIKRDFTDSHKCFISYMNDELQLCILELQMNTFTYYTQVHCANIIKTDL